MPIPTPENEHVLQSDDEIDLTQTTMFGSPPIGDEALDNSNTDIASDSLIEITQAPAPLLAQPIIEKTNSKNKILGI